MIANNTKKGIIGWAFFISMIIKPIIDLFWQAPLILGKIKFIWLPYIILPVILILYGFHNFKWKKHESALIGIIIISIIITFFHNEYQSLEVYIRMIGAVLPILFFEQIINNLTRKDVILFLKLYLWSLILPCFISLMQAIGWYPQFEKYLFTGGYSMQNTFIAYLIPAFIAAVYMAFYQKKSLYLLLSAIYLFYLSAVNMTTTRITMVIIVAVFTISYLYKDKNIKAKYLKKLTYIYSIPFIAVFIYTVVKFDINVSNRNWVWGQYAEYLKTEGTILNLAFGTGGIPREIPHNDYLGIFIVFGIIVLALYLYLIRKRLKQCIDGISKHSQEWLLRACLISSVIAWFFNSMMVTISYYMIMTWTNMIWIILIAVLTKEEEQID